MGGRDQNNFYLKTIPYSKCFGGFRTIVLTDPMTLSWRSCRFEPLRAYRADSDSQPTMSQCISSVHAIEHVYSLFSEKPKYTASGPLGPKHGSWLNMAECELSVLSRQCLARRISDQTELAAEIKAWETARNGVGSRCNWQVV